MSTRTPLQSLAALAACVLSLSAHAQPSAPTPEGDVHVRPMMHHAAGQGHAAPDFASVRQKALEGIAQRERMLEQARRCVSAAQDFEQLKQCRHDAREQRAERQHERQHERRERRGPAAGSDTRP